MQQTQCIAHDTLKGKGTMIGVVLPKLKGKHVEQDSHHVGLKTTLNV